MVTDIKGTISRDAQEGDKQNLANLIHFGSHVHRHLDWRTPLEWIGYNPYLILKDGDDLVAALACPPDPPNVAWIRLFAGYDAHHVEPAWEILWGAALDYLKQYAGLSKIAAIPLHNWFCELLEKSKFTSPHKVVVLSWRRGQEPQTARDLDPLSIRPMLLDDLTGIEQIDADAFGGVWQNSQSCLEIAFRQSAIATVAEINGSIAGYQISTSTQAGGHLARLAVHPEYQGRGIGYGLVLDMLSQFRRRGAHTVTANTQHDNLVSLSLYQKAGFERTGEEYPLFEYDLN
jgi:ribosomal protein S18 acetylase RimI-like enzyme